MAKCRRYAAEIIRVSEILELYISQNHYSCLDGMESDDKTDDFERNYICGFGW